MTAKSSLLWEDVQDMYDETTAIFPISLDLIFWYG
jgi:hypothetical protein